VPRFDGAAVKPKRHDAPEVLKRSEPLSDARSYEDRIRALIETEQSRLNETDPVKQLTDAGRSRAVGNIIRLRAELGSGLSDAQVIQLPGFRRLLDTIYAALDPWPDAYQAVLAALKQVTDGDGRAMSG